MQEKPFDCMHKKKYRDDAKELYYSEESLKCGYVPQEICAARVPVSAFELFASLPASIWTSVDYQHYKKH